MQWHISEECSPQQHHHETIKIKKIVLPWLLKKFLIFYGNLKAHYRVHNTPQSISILYHTYPVHAFPSCFSMIHFNIIFSTKPKSCKWSQTNTWVVFSLFHSNPTLPSDTEISEHFSGSTGMNLKMMDYKLHQNSRISMGHYTLGYSTDLSEAVDVRSCQGTPACRDLVC